MNLEQEQVQQYLNDNFSFAKDWFVKNASKEFIREWFDSRRPKSINDLSAKNEEPGPDLIRKSIEHCLDPEQPNLSSFYSKIRTKNSDRNPITAELFNDIVEKGFQNNQKVQSIEDKKKTRQDFDGLTDDQLLMEMMNDITNELNVDILCHKILVNVCILIHCDRASLFLAKGSRNHRYLVAKLFDVTPKSMLEDALILASSKNNHNPIPPIPFGTGIVGHVALTKQNVNIGNVYDDPRFNKDIDIKTGYQTKSLICQPIVNFSGDVIGVAECINKLPEGSVFSEKDEAIFKKYLTFCGFCIQNAQLFEMSLMEYKRYQLLLNLAKTVFEDTTKLETMITKIMIRTKSLLESDKSRVYIMKEQIKDQEEIFRSVFELTSQDGLVRSINLDGNNHETPMSYAKQAALAKKTLNSDNFLEPEIDHNVSILSVPIFNNENKVLGVAQLIKSASREVFTDVEISVIEAFSIFCGLGLQSCMLYEEAVKLNARQQVALECLAYHASAGEEETNKLMNTLVPTSDVYHLNSFEFDDHSLSDDQTAIACLRIFIDMDFIETFRIPYKVLCRWILSVKKNYRNVIYHNWRHALNVAQTMFVMLSSCDLKTILDSNEQLALIVASLCHDLDHRGLNNSFQLKTCHPLTKIYSTSYMENHHFNHTMLILKSEGNDIFAETPTEVREEIIKIIEECILSTDLAQYMSKKDKFSELVYSGQLDIGDARHKELLRAMLMTACDLSAICKPWHIQKRVAELVSDEFYLQGDLEASLNLDPLPMMDRKQKDNLPKGQVSFIDNICLPVYQILKEFWPKLEPLYAGCMANREKWQSLINDIHEQHHNHLRPE